MSISNPFPPQTAAEDDLRLVECFYDKKYLEDLLDQNYSFITGRKGSGKTALAQYAVNSNVTTGRDYCEIISLTRDMQNPEDISSDRSRDKSLVSSRTLLYIIVKLVWKMLEWNDLEDNYKTFWVTFLQQNGWNTPTGFARFHETTRSDVKIFNPQISGGGFSASAFSDQSTKGWVETKISVGITDLWEAFLKSVPEKRVMHLFIDDVDTRIDPKTDPDNEAIYRFLEGIVTFNRAALSACRAVRITVCVRSDIWRHLYGSNAQKLETNSLSIEWDEGDFFGLIAKRINPGADNNKARETVQQLFPEAPYNDFMKGNQYQHFGTNFYAYIKSMSFNRPRDFLRYCWLALRKFPTWPKDVHAEHIAAVETEFSAYLRNELKNEVYLLCQKYEIKPGTIDKFIDSLANRPHSVV